MCWGQDLPRLEQKRDIKSPVVIRSTLVSRAFRINLKQRPISFLLILLTAHISCYNTEISDEDSGTVSNHGTFYNLRHNSQKPVAVYNKLWHKTVTNHGTDYNKLWHEKSRSLYKMCFFSLLENTQWVVPTFWDNLSFPSSGFKNPKGSL